MGVGFAAINTANNLLYLLLGMLLALIVVSGVMSELSLRDLSVLRRLPQRAQVGRAHMLGEKPKAGFDRIQAIQPKQNAEELYGTFPSDGKANDVLDIIERIVDGPNLLPRDESQGKSASGFEQFKEDYGKTIVFGYGRIDGWARGYCSKPAIDRKE